MLHVPPNLPSCAALRHIVHTIYFIGHCIWSIAAQTSVQPVLAHHETCQSAKLVRKGPWCSVPKYGSIWKSALML